MMKDLIVVDDYFPDWQVERVSDFLKLMPVVYSNTSEFDYTKTRFFGTMLMEMDNWVAHPFPPYWFVDYFNMCIINDILKDRDIQHCHRMLLNGQVPGLDGANHQDDPEVGRFMSVIYHASGDSGDTVCVTPEGEEIDRVTFKPGRIVIFPSEIWHRGDSPSQGYRVSLGCMYPLVTIDNLPQIY